MFSSIATAFFYFGGILFYLLMISLFDYNVSNAIKITAFFFSLVPILGPALFATLFTISLFSYQVSGFRTREFVQVKRTKLNHYLFNDVDWENWDLWINEKSSENK